MGFLVIKEGSDSISWGDGSIQDFRGGFEGGLGRGSSGLGIRGSYAGGAVIVQKRVPFGPRWLFRDGSVDRY